MLRNDFLQIYLHSSWSGQLIMGGFADTKTFAWKENSCLWGQSDLHSHNLPLSLSLSLFLSFSLSIELY